MRKIFSFIAAILFVESMMAEEINPTSMTCAEAAAAALSVSGNNVEYNNGEIIVVEGYVTEIAVAYSTQFHNLSFWMADEPNGGRVLEAYRCLAVDEESAPKVGDHVRVYGKLTKYNSTPEFAQACYFEMVEAYIPQNLGHKSIAEFLELKNFTDTCELTGVVLDVYNTKYGNLHLVEDGDTLDIYGLLTADGQAQQFASLNVEEEDTLTIKAVHTPTGITQTREVTQEAAN